MGLSQLSPVHVIPVGTQVVLTRDLDVVGGGAFRKRGSVGEVLEAPISNEYSYVVGFADGQMVRARRAHLVVRRSDLPEAALPGREVEAFAPWVVYRVVVGSRAYGLADEGSDTDERGVYVPPAEWHWSLQPLPGQVEFKRLSDGTVVEHDVPDHAEDVCWWEVGKLVRLALKANPNVLELLWVDERHVLHCDGLGEELRSIRSCFLSRYLHQTYSGYVLSQFRKMRKTVERGGVFRAKHAMHLIRLLHSGIAAARGRGILVEVGEHREELLAIKAGEIPFEQIHRRALELERELQMAFHASSLPDRPDVERVDRFLIGARRSRVGQ